MYIPRIGMWLFGWLISSFLDWWVGLFMWVDKFANQREVGKELIKQLLILK